MRGVPVAWSVTTPLMTGPRVRVAFTVVVLPTASVTGVAAPATVTLLKYWVMKPSDVMLTVYAPAARLGIQYG